MNRYFVNNITNGAKPDGTKCFTGFEFQSYSKNLGIRHMNESPFHPQLNGCAESAVKINKTFFKENVQLAL